MTKICHICGTKNQDSSEFCQNCGNKLQETLKTTKSKKSTKNVFMEWWYKQSPKKQFLTIIGILFFSIIIISAVIALLIPNDNLTLISLNNVTPNGTGEAYTIINNNTTEYEITGSSEPNATITITSDVLNKTNETITLDPNNQFSYKINIPSNVSEFKIRFDAKKPGKNDSNVNLSIKKQEEEQNQTKPPQTSIPNKTYSDQGLTFNYPDSWKTTDPGSPAGIPITTPNGGSLYVIDEGSIKEYASQPPSIPATLDAVADDIRYPVNGTYDKKNVTIGGVRGIEYIPTGYGYGGQRVDVVFAKGNKLYSIFLTTDDYNADKDGFEMIIKTMQIQ